MAILIVLGYHCKASYGFPARLKSAFDLFDGPLGVRFFFSISGFIITWLLIGEHEQRGKVHLSAFYVRRALRILPVYWSVLIVLFGLQVLTPFHQSPRVWLANLTFTTNFLDRLPWPSAHLWSLAVEEQFYLVWPGLFVALGLATSLRRSTLVLLVPIAAAPVFRVLSYLHTHSHRFEHPLVSPLLSRDSFFNYADQLAFGCLAALLLAMRREWLESRLLRHPLPALILAVLLIGVPQILTWLLLMGAVVVPFGSTLQAIGFAMLLLQSVLRPTFFPYRFLNEPIVMQIGVLSYSIYVWQQIFCSNPESFGLSDPLWMSFPGWLVTTFAVSVTSFYVLERPLFQLRHKFR